ncbi:tyrosine-protein phosphatase non-receptor type 14-like [Octopus sinensis]|uniref:Tyrosine-protein phosphatase non-receptor type 14-like n=1 Tax=Octopus sinensis TaxID=2607531 RepID=A0A6P7SSI6_9MOLL|nr:tyrosine-protein phosphatase non-receptor type 14-like [Octopus sinensis]
MKSVDIDTKDGMKVIVFAFDRVCFETMVFPHTVGHECMAFAIHQLGITDARYFGFRHVTNDVRVEWIDLNKPLGTQLDKHCSQHCFYFGVMYYISRAYNIKDEAALYQYFRQLHVDYLYSQYDCLLERAIKLASFYLRVILGPYDPKTHTVTTVGRHLLFPASIRRDEKIATAAQEKAFQNYQTLHISSTTSMVFYIIEFESATYYGLECHPAILSESREAVHLITSYNGIMVKYLRSPDAFLLKWSDIAAVTRSQKSSIIIQQLSRSIQLELADKKRAKYFFQMAFLLMHFYQDNPEFCDRSTKEPAKPDGYESYSLLLSSSQSETLRSVLRYQQSLTSIPDNVRSSPKSLYEATETAQYLLAQPSRPEQTALGATEAITSPSKPLTSVSAAEIRLDEELFLTGSKDIKYEAKKLNKSSQTQSFYISMINERFQKYTETSPMHLLSQTLKNILQYLDAIEKAEGETQADIKSKQSTEKHFSDSQPLKESGIPYRYPPKYPFPKTKSKDTDIDPAKPITVGQILKRVQDIQVRDKSTESVSPAKLEKSKESKVSETQTMLPSRKYTYLNHR